MVLNSLMKPSRLTVVGSDGHTYDFLCKVSTAHTCVPTLRTERTAIVRWWQRAVVTAAVCCDAPYISAARGEG